MPYEGIPGIISDGNGGTMPLPTAEGKRADKEAAPDIRTCDAEEEPDERPTKRRRLFMCHMASIGEAAGGLTIVHS